MSNLSDDIIKYKKGELSPEEMHALEKRSLSDPFLADALEGVENISVEELTEDISTIEERIKKKKKTVFTPLRLAAGIVLLIVSVFTIYQLIPRSENLALQTEKPKAENKVEEPKQPKTEKPIETKNVESKKLKDESELKSPERSASNIPPSSSKINLADGKNPGSKSKVLAQAPSSGLPSSEVAHQGDLKIAEAKPNEIVVSAEEEAKPNAGVSKKESLAASQSRSASGYKNNTIQTLSGKVVSADGSPLPGVNVLIKGTSTGTVTDANGNYIIHGVDRNQSMIFSFIGMQSKEVMAGDQEKLDVELKEDVSQLSEVVVTGFGIQKDENAEPVIKLATPIGGRKAYDKYLESNLQYPPDALENKIKGRVTIEFMVDINGSLDHFKVIKSLGYGCDEEVIRLVKEGPKWSPTTEDDKPVESTVRVRMKFDPDKANR